MELLRGKSLVVLNTSVDAIQLLQTWFEARGMIVHTANVAEFRKGGRDLAQFIAESAPDVVIYDVALPYVANWKFLQSLRQDGPLGRVPLIVTTPNERVLAAVATISDATPLHEIVGKPADMEQLTSRITRLIATRA